MALSWIFKVIFDQMNENNGFNYLPIVITFAPAVGLPSVRVRIHFDFPRIIRRCCLKFDLSNAEDQILIYV